MVRRTPTKSVAVDSMPYVHIIKSELFLEFCVILEIYFVKNMFCVWQPPTPTHTHIFNWLLSNGKVEELSKGRGLFFKQNVNNVR